MGTLTLAMWFTSVVVAEGDHNMTYQCPLTAPFRRPNLLAEERSSRCSFLCLSMINGADAGERGLVYQSSTDPFDLYLQ